MFSQFLTAMRLSAFTVNYSDCMRIASISKNIIRLLIKSKYILAQFLWNSILVDINSKKVKIEW